MGKEWFIGRKDDGMEQKYKMIALDLDGTLNNDAKEITPKTREALLKVQAQGVTVVLASGRQAPGLQREAEALDLAKHHGLLLSYNGGRIEDATTHEILFDKSLPNALAVRFLRHLEKFSVSPVVDNGKAILTTCAYNYKVQDESRNNNMAVEIVDNIADAVEAQGVSPAKILTAAQNETLVPLLPYIREGFTEEMDFVQSAPWFYEGTAKGVSKSESLRRVCERLGIAPAKVMAFGDAQNDMSMLDFAGYGVAMGNACEELKAMADEVTLSNNEDGIAVSLAKHFGV